MNNSSLYGMTSDLNIDLSNLLAKSSHWIG